MCIVTSTNAITCNNYGIAKTIVSKFPYGYVVGIRYTEIGRSYACSRDRGIVGLVMENLHSTSGDKPTILTMITQYGIGTTIEDNTFPQSAVMYAKDWKHAENLRKDTRQERILNFHQCLAELRNRLLSQNYFFFHFYDFFLFLYISLSMIVIYDFFFHS